MLPSLKNIKELFAADDFQNYYLGQALYLNHEVKNLQITECGPATEIVCQVRDCPVTVQLNLEQSLCSLSATCTCKDFASTGACSHVAAALLASIGPDAPRIRQKSFSSPLHTTSDDNARRLLELYLDRSRRKALSFSTVGDCHLSPRLTGFSDGNGFPALSLALGIKRMYVIRDIQSFLEAVERKKTLIYGRNLAINHSLHNFDLPSQQLIGLLMDQFPQFRTMGVTRQNVIPGWPHGSLRSEIVLDGPAFDSLFTLLTSFPQVYTLAGGNSSTTLPITVREGDPEIHIRLSRIATGTQMTLKFPEDTVYFSTRSNLYAYGQGALLRCSATFRESIYPLLSLRQERFLFSDADMPGFCSCVLPDLQNCANLETDGSILDQYVPDECYTRFYFDLGRDALTLKIGFLYGDREISGHDSLANPEGIRRDLVSEQNSLDFARSFFPNRENREAPFRLSGDDAIFDFLSSSLDAFSNRGDVFISERLRKRRLLPVSPRVGISIRNSKLTLDIDSGDFPLEELDDLYESMLKKLRYYRLKDGRYLALDGSPLERLAEVAHMLRLTGDQLKKGTIELPAFRALYLDSAFTDQDGFRLTRDNQFRSMVRNFRSFSDSDYSPPDCVASLLRPYQLQGYQWLKTLESCGFCGILADDMGLGKTLQMISFFASSPRSSTGAPSLVVCPSSLVLNWMDEFSKFAPHLQVVAVIGPAAERARRMKKLESVDVAITSYELLRQDIEHYAPFHFYCCTLDEGQFIKNSSTQISHAVKMIDCRQRFILTGTPIENRLSELWNLFDFLMPGYLFSHRTFLEKLERPAVMSKDPQALDQLRRLVQPFMLRRLKKDVLKELPPKIELVQRISLSERELMVYHATCKRILDAANGGGSGGVQVGKMRLLAGLTQLREICCDPGLCFENYEGPTSKLDACMELCSTLVEGGHQILLFSQFTTMLDRIRTRLKAMNISSYTLQGSTSKESRARLVREFNNHRVSIFLISLKAGGTGLNLTSADVVIHFDPWWNQAAQDQATDRAYRIGQENTVQVFRLITENTIEEKIMELQQEKAGLMDALSAGTGQSLLSMSRDDLLGLLE